MCGIAGIISLSRSSEELPLLLKTMSDTIRHRGPDDEGFLLVEGEQITCISGNDTQKSVIESHIAYRPVKHIDDCKGSFSLGLAHRRLSIIDLSPAGHQPLSYKERYWITFNGEIYNYLELKAELLKVGYEFRTATDTEVILAAYDAWGTDCFSRFNGMWSLLIFDSRDKKVIASRDRQGVKPFYYYIENEYFCFASEQKAIVSLPFVRKKINSSEVFDFFILNRFENDSTGFFENIVELKPGHFFTLELSSGRSATTKYFSDPSLKNINISDADAIEAIREKFMQSVKLRLRSDVKVGSCLSGGIDSSAIVGAMRKLLPEGDIHVFTAAFPGLNIDESGYAKTMSDHVKATQHTVTPNEQELIKDLEDLIYCQDIPIWSTSTYAQFRVMKLVAENNIKVILDGQGGDELFAGYHTYYFSYWKELLRKGKLRQLMKEVNNVQGSTGLFLRSFIKDQLIPALPAGIRMATLMKLYPEFNYLNPDLIQENLARLNHDKGSHSDLNQDLYREFHGNRLKGYLKCEDRCAMWFSVESRVPFADDHQLSDFAFSLPSDLKIRNGVNKYVLRESIKDLVPELIVNRKDKMGYVTPNNRWIKDIRKDIRDVFGPGLDPYINREKLLKDYDKLFSPSGSVDTGRVFKFISFAVWLNRFFPGR